MIGRLVVFIVCALALASPAVADASWLEPVVVSSHGWNGHVAMNADGLALAVYPEADPSGWGTVGVAAAVRQPGGGWGAPQEIYASDAATSLAVGGDGSMYVTLATSGGDAYVTIAEPGQPFGPPVLLGHGSSGRMGASVAADEQGRAVAAYVGDADPDVMVASREPGRPFGPAQAVGHWADAAPKVAMNRTTGTAWVAWPSFDFDGRHMMFARRPAGGDFSAPAEAAGSDPHEQIIEYALQAAGPGDALINWTGFNGYDPAPFVMHIRAALMRAGHGPITFGPATAHDHHAFAAIGDGGAATVAWGGSYGEPFVAAVAPAGGGFGAPQALAATTDFASGGAAVDSAGNVIVFFGTPTDPPRTNAALLPPGATSFCTPVDVGPGAVSRLSTAVDAHGRATTVFQRFKSSEVTAVDYTAAPGCPPIPEPPAPLEERPLAPAATIPVVPRLARVRIGSRATISRSARSVRVTVSCLTGADCRGTVALSRMHARRAFAVSAGRQRSLRLGLTRREARALKRHKRMHLRVAASLPGAPTVTRTLLVR